MHGEFAATTAAEFVAGGEEAFARVAFAEEFFVLVSELVPEGLEGFVVGTVDDMCESFARLSSAPSFIMGIFLGIGEPLLV